MEIDRTEKKFILNREQSLQLQRRLEPLIPRDVFCTRPEGYDVRSLYFDTITDRCCAEKEEGLQVHEKIRIRVYGTDDSVIKLESKRKVGQLQTKRTMSISRDTMQALIHGQYSLLLEQPDPLGPYFFRKLSEGMVPRAIIRYNRISYCQPTNNTRITLDYHIQATESSFDLFQEPLQTHPIFPENLVIAEVKFNNFLLGYLKQALGGLDKSPASFSKYFSGRTFYRRLL